MYTTVLFIYFIYYQFCQTMSIILFILDFLAVLKSIMGNYIKAKIGSSLLFVYIDMYLTTGILIKFYYLPSVVFT